MIYLKRKTQTKAIKAALHGPPGGVDTEMEAARAYYNADPPPTKSYKFTRYKAPEVKKRLEDTFFKKCAYCESIYATVGPVDIEHFRPKGGVTECPDDHPGYWWLAAEWRNLLPSCIDCNRKRNQLTYQPDLTFEELVRARIEAAMETSGKANSFPTGNNKWALKETENIKNEDPLLINPCDVKPEKHLEWDFDQNSDVPIWKDKDFMPIVLPKIDADGNIDPYGKTSIDVYGLNREELLRARKFAFLRLLKLCDPILNTLKVYQLGVPPAVRQLLETQMEQYQDNLYSEAEPEMEYSSFLSAFIDEFEKQLEKWPVEDY